MSERTYRGIVGRYVRGEIRESDLYRAIVEANWKPFNPAEHTPLPLDEDFGLPLGDYDILKVANMLGDVSDELYESIDGAIRDQLAAATDDDASQRR